MSFLLGVVLVGAVVLLLAFLALLQRVADKTHDERHEMDAKLNALRDFGPKTKGTWHGSRYY